jgi:hypothetical protein
VFNALLDALNQAYDIEKDERPWWKKRLIAIACLVGVGATFVLATVVMLAGGDIVNAVADRLGIGAFGRLAWTVAQYAIALGLLVGTAWAIYFYLPCVRQHKMHALAGAIATTVLWLIVTMAFRFYVQNFGSYNKTYGTIGGVIVLLTWMYLSMVVLLTGGELASELHKGTGAVRTRAGHLYGSYISDGRPTEAASVDRVERVDPPAAASAASSGFGGPLAPCALGDAAGAPAVSARGAPARAGAAPPAPRGGVRAAPPRCRRARRSRRARWSRPAPPASRAPRPRRRAASPARAPRRRPRRRPATAGW